MSGSPPSKSIALKDEGNRHFQSGDFAGADALYSKAILVDPKNPTIFTNRAMARLRLCMWDSAIADCRASLDLSPGRANMKASYYLSQALLALGDADAALDHALAAHALCAASLDRSLAAVTAQVLRCKKDRWDHAERRRLRERDELEADILRALEARREQAVRDADAQRADVSREWDAKIEQAKELLDRARGEEGRRRAVPDWSIDDISFAIMVDPVITKTGKSYERASIMEHLSRSRTDPLTREPLLPSDLRPNLGLKQACEEFLDQNGWAVDW